MLMIEIVCGKGSWTCGSWKGSVEFTNRYWAERSGEDMGKGKKFDHRRVQTRVLR